jgi:acetate kinase
MKTIIVNNGSASKKYALFDGEKEVLSSHYEKTPSSFILTETIGNSDTEIGIDESIFTESFSDFINKLIEKKLIVNRKEISAVAVRVVAPGLYFQEHHLVDNEYLYNLDNISDLSPLHVKPTQIEISNIKDELSDVRIFAISDSAYHKTMNQSAKLYAFPKKLIEKLGLYRYGYHGISVNSVVDEVKNNYGEFNNIIVCHLGGGSSITAVKNGQSFDTTMGFSPLEGLPMATRAGSADPNALISIMDSEDFDTKELQNFLYKECGLKGLSGISSDTRVILDEVAKGNQDAINALELYVYQVQKTIGAYSTVLGGFDALVFTGTIGERSAEVRKRICAGLQTLGVFLDPGKNKIQINGDGSIHGAESKIKIFAIRTKEIKEMSKILQTLV